MKISKKTVISYILGVIVGAIVAVTTHFVKLTVIDVKNQYGECYNYRTISNIRIDSTKCNMTDSNGVVIK